MFAASLISLPPETLRRLAEDAPVHGGGGARGERRYALLIAASALFVALLSATLAA